ncbi:MAG TPA: RES domain-containing protein [Bryobacteraceae bacterium]|nr:RES domain-containing protein [Bryobacteraceae bacterium]
MAVILNRQACLGAPAILRTFRIADCRHPLLDGLGAFLNGGRWNSKGRRVIYSSETYAGALLEILVHANIGKVPKTQAWIEIWFPEALKIEEVTAAEVPGWNADDMLASRAYGDRWLEERRTAVLVVPSMVTAGVERNVVINQDHPDFALLESSEPQEVAWDARLFGTQR